jgi:threonine dehydrogenase-like Zn-dependent dehydrogenase
VEIEGGSGFALRQCIAATRRGGVVSVPGVYSGWLHGFLFGDAFDKGLTFRMGQTHVQQHMPALLEHIGNGDLHPEAIVTHRLPLAAAADGYALFDEKREECRKVVLSPGGGAASGKRPPGKRR